MSSDYDFVGRLILSVPVTFTQTVETVACRRLADFLEIGTVFRCRSTDSRLLDGIPKRITMISNLTVSEMDLGSFLAI